MSTPLFVVLGASVGLMGTMPMALMLERVLKGGSVPSPVPVAVAILVPLVLMCAIIVIVRYVCATMLEAFALAMIATVIVVWATEGVRAWLAAQRSASKEGM